MEQLKSVNGGTCLCLVGGSCALSAFRDLLATERRGRKPKTSILVATPKKGPPKLLLL